MIKSTYEEGISMDSSYYVNESIYSTTDSAETIAVVAIIVVLLFYLLIMGIGLASYIMNAIALYKIADRRQIPNPWMSWLPFTRDWLIGRIADDYDGKNGIKRKWRAVLLTLSLISVVGLVVIYVALIVWIITIAVMYTNTEPPFEQVMVALVVLYVILIVLAILSTAKSFCQAICIYKIFESTVPEKAVKYLLLYLLVPLGGPICLIRCKDKGYPYPQQQEFVSYETPEIPEQESEQF